MSILVTGGCGFIGSHVVEKLRAQGHDTIVIDRAHPEDPVELTHLESGELYGVNAVIHCAAHADVRRNWQNTSFMPAIWGDIVDATMSLLGACAEMTRVKSFVFVSTGAVYAEQMSPYAASKLSGEVWCKAYAAKFGWGLTIIRPAACFGRGYKHGHVADFVAMAKDGGQIKAMTRGLPRDALHVEDLADALIDASTRGTFSARERTYYMRGETQWGCRDTAAEMLIANPDMRLPEWGSQDLEWLGDSSTGHLNFVMGSRSIRDGVIDALKSLGWGK